MKYGLEDSVVDAFLGVTRTLLSSDGIQVAVIGAVARNLLAEPRTTKDGDFGLIVRDAAAYQALYQKVEALGFSLLRETSDPPEEYPTIAQFVRGGFQIDFLIAKTPFELEAVRSAVMVESTTQALPVVLAEDLITYKLIAGAPKIWLASNEPNA